MTDRESTFRTLAVAAGVALFCSLLVSTAVYWLRPIQLGNRSIEQARAIVETAGLSPVGEPLTDRDIITRYLQFDARIVDLDAGTYIDAGIDAGDAPGASPVSDYDYRSAIDDPKQTRAIASPDDIAGLGRRPRYMPVYLMRDGRNIERIVLPIYGPGMWSTIYGFLSLGPDLTTVAGVRFHEHGETAGIGDRIQEADWTAQWPGKRIYADDGEVALRIGSDTANGAPDYRIDSITGATVTVDAVDEFVRYWLGEDGYGSFLANMRDEVQ